MIRLGAKILLLLAFLFAIPASAQFHGPTTGVNSGTSPTFGTVTATSFVGAVTGNSSTATALAADPADCSAGSIATAIAASGALTCSTPSALGLIQVLSTTTGIDGKATGTTTLYTVPSGKTAVITGAIIRLTTVSVFAVTGTMGIGVAAGEADIFPSTALLGLDTATEAFSFLNALGIQVVATQGQVIKLGIDTGYTATTATLAVDLLGYLL